MTWSLILLQFLPLLAMADTTTAGVSTLNYQRFENLTLSHHPMLQEEEIDLALAARKLMALKAGVLLPRFEVEVGMGPAPGLRNSSDTLIGSIVDTSLGQVDPDKVALILEPDREFDFSEWGPFFGMELTVAQPLNYARYLAGLEATKHEIRVSEAEFRKEVMAKSFESQEIYFQYLFALRMDAILREAQKDLADAEDKIEEMLDEEDPSVTQADLLKLRAGTYALTQGLGEAQVGVRRAEAGIRFFLQWPARKNFVLDDSILTPRGEPMPSLDSLKQMAMRLHPDLKRLRHGLVARKAQVKVAKGEMGPDIFLFGNLKYTKAWSSDRVAGSDDPFVQDPLNELSGVGGIGVRMRLNVWDRYQNYRKSKLELQQLERTENYAAEGVLLLLEEAYWKWAQADENVKQSSRSLRAAEAWLKSAAMKYDLDPGRAKDMIDPYRTVIGSRRDYFEAVMEFNIKFAKVLQQTGWTLSNYLDTLEQGPG